MIAPIASEEALAAAAEQGVDLGAIEQSMVAVPRVRRMPSCPRSCTSTSKRLDPDGTEPDPTEGRRLSIARHADGAVTGRFDLDAVGGEKVRPRSSRSCRPTGRRGMTGRGCSRTPTRSCSCATTSSPPAPSRRCARRSRTSIVAIDAEDLADSTATGPGAGKTGFGARISAARTRWLACDGSISRIVMGPDGQPLDVGRTQRVVPAHIRRAVERRDGHCVFAGCTAPTHWCDVHHLVHWIDGGETSVANSGLVCERHHTKVHHGFRIERDPGGRWHTYRPDGTEILIGPPLLI